jgi:hypothetical protein
VLVHQQLVHLRQGTGQHMADMGWVELV